MANRRRRGDSPELSAEMLEDAEQAFSMVDPNNSGLMEAKDLKVAMRALGYEPKKDEIKDLVAKYAQDDPESGRHMIPRSSFLRLVAKRSEEMDTEKEILKAFRLFDDDATGKISLKNLQRVAKQLGESVADTELKEMISEADRDGDGEVSLEDFKRIMKKTCLY